MDGKRSKEELKIGKLHGGKNTTDKTKTKKKLKESTFDNYKERRRV